MRAAVSSVQVDGAWHASDAAPRADEAGPAALVWGAGAARATTRLIPYEGGIVVECELENPGPQPITFDAWRPIVIDPAHSGSLHVGEEPWRASTLVNGYQSWDYAGVHPLDDAIKQSEMSPPHESWWTCAIYGPDRRTMFVAQVLRATRFASAFHWRYHRDQSPSWQLPTAITSWFAEQGGSPLSQPEQRSGAAEAMRLTIAPGARVSSDPILILCGEDGTATLKRALQLAGRASGARTFPSPPRGWCSWYHLGRAVTAQDIRRHAAFIARRLSPLVRSAPPPHRPVVQLDDGWMPRWGDWTPNERFPEGLRPVVQAVRRHRLEAGIWLAPFLVDRESSLATEHPDWLVKDRAGGPLADPRLNGSMYVLDGTHPQALEFLQGLFTGLRRDGFSYFKLDFLYAGAYEGIRHDPLATGTEALRRGLKRIFDAVNPPRRRDQAFVLACGAPILPIVGLVHGNRIGGDVGAPVVQDGKAGPPALGFNLILSMARNQAARVFCDRTLFANDPDVAMAAAPQLTIDEAQVMLTVAALSGGVFLYSDDLETLPAERLKLLRNPNLLALAGGPAAEPVHLFAAPELEAKDHWFAFPAELPPLWVRREGPDRLVVAIYNWSVEPRPYQVRFSDLGEQRGPFRVFDLWSPRRGGRAIGEHAGSLRLRLRPHSVRLLRMEVAARPDAPPTSA